MLDSGSGVVGVLEARSHSDQCHSRVRVRTNADLPLSMAPGYCLPAGNSLSTIGLGHFEWGLLMQPFDRVGLLGVQPGFHRVGLVEIADYFCRLRGTYQAVENGHLAGDQNAQCPKDQADVPGSA